jgi:hypothetical protein
MSQASRPLVQAISHRGREPLRLAVPNLVTNAYFPALAAEALGYYAAGGYL